MDCSDAKAAEKSFAGAGDGFAERRLAVELYAVDMSSGRVLVVVG